MRFNIHCLALSIVCCILTATGFSQNSAVTLKGIVFHDKNGNGSRDSDEPGVGNVWVSDQVEITSTDTQGMYTLISGSHLGNVYITQPEGYQVEGSFWRPIPSGQKEVNIDFALTVLPKSNSYVFIHASDPHLSEQSMPRLERLRFIVDSVKASFVIMTGDLVKDALRVPEEEATRLYEMYDKTIKTFRVPVWNVPGNHEIFGIERHKSLVSEKHPLYGKKMYRHYLGPDYYSFNYGGVHFIGLNSVDYHDLWYYGHIDSLQLTWLRKESERIPKEKTVITFNHIPFYSGGMSLDEYSDGEPGSTLITINGSKKWRHVVTNAEEVINLFSAHNYPVALGGHFHAAQKFTIDAASPKTEFHQTGAIVGPSSNGGFQMPSGVVLYTVKDGQIKERKFIPIKILSR